MILCMTVSHSYHRVSLCLGFEKIYEPIVETDSQSATHSPPHGFVHLFSYLSSPLTRVREDER